MLIFLAFLATSTSPIVFTQAPIEPISNEQLVREYLGEHMIPTIKCESDLRQFDSDGTVLKSKTNDIGIAQINKKTWGQKALELGYDIYTTLGNLKMAKHILEKQGEKAWVCHKIIEKKLLTET